MPAARINPHFPLVDDGLLVTVHILHRVLNGHNMTTAITVAIIYEGRQRGRLTRTGCPHKQHQPAFAHDHLGQDRRQPQVLPLGNIGDNVTGNNAHFIALYKYIDPETPITGDRGGKIHLQLLLKLGLLGGIHDLVGDILDFPRLHNLAGDRLELSLKFGAGRRACAQIQVRATLVRKNFEPLGNSHAISPGYYCAPLYSSLSPPDKY